jgi:maltokinase
MTEERWVLGRRGELDETMLVEYLREQRWFGARSREISRATPVDVVSLGESSISVALVDVHFKAGTRDLYQLLIEERDGATLDGSAVAATGRRLIELAAHNEKREGSDGRLRFNSIRPIEHMGSAATKVTDGEQSNTSIVAGDLILKAYRRVEAGVNPELEMLLFFAEHDFVHVPGLAAWYGYEGNHVEATLGIVQLFVASAVDGWKLGLDEVPRAPNEFLDRIEALGSVVATMHTVLASDTTDAAFAPEDPTPETTGLLAARMQEGVDSIFDEFGDREELAPLIGRRDDAHALIAALGGSLAPGRLIRTHGDLHLGQTLWNGKDWFIIDFEGEPIRAASNRRQKAFPLRDVAGIMRSFSYLVHGLENAGNRGPDNWEQRARTRLFAGYRAAAPAAVLPITVEAQERQVALFELERAFYELRYELEHRPDFVAIPVDSIVTILERGAS